jgi:hypothetical protein
MSEFMDYATPENLNYAMNAAGKIKSAYSKYNYRRKVAYGKRFSQSRVFKRPLTSDRNTIFGNGIRKSYGDMLSLSKVKDALFPRWNLKTNVSTKSFTCKPGRQHVLEHEYMDSETINSYINKSKDIVTTSIFAEPNAVNHADSLNASLIGDVC